jgi:hypothetical protein
VVGVPFLGDGMVAVLPLVGIRDVNVTDKEDFLAALDE